MKTLVRSFSLLALLGLATTANSQNVVSYFNFNSLPTSGAIDVTAVAPNIGSGSLESNFSSGIARADPGSPSTPKMPTLRASHLLWAMSTTSTTAGICN